MLLGVIIMFCFEILMILEKNRKIAKLEIWAYWAPTPRHRPTPLSGLPRRGEAKGPKMAPLEHTTT